MTQMPSDFTWWVLVTIWAHGWGLVLWRRWRKRPASRPEALPSIILTILLVTLWASCHRRTEGRPPLVYGEWRP